MKKWDFQRKVLYKVLQELLVFMRDKLTRIVPFISSISHLIDQWRFTLSSLTVIDWLLLKLNKKCMQIPEVNVRLQFFVETVVRCEEREPFLYLQSRRTVSTTVNGSVGRVEDCRGTRCPWFARPHPNKGYLILQWNFDSKFSLWKPHVTLD